jgi:hypothetical protein
MGHDAEGATRTAACRAAHNPADPAIKIELQEAVPEMGVNRFLTQPFSPLKLGRHEQALPARSRT